MIEKKQGEKNLLPFQKCIDDINKNGLSVITVQHVSTRYEHKATHAYTQPIKVH